MALTPVITIVAAPLIIGTAGAVESSILDPSATKAVVVTTPTALAWPASGAVVKLIVEESNDGGENYRFSASNTLSGGVWNDRLGGILAFDTWTTTLMFSGSNRKIRLTLDVLQPCTVGVVANVQ